MEMLRKVHLTLWTLRNPNNCVYKALKCVKITKDKQTKNAFNSVFMFRYLVFPCLSNAHSQRDVRHPELQLMRGDAQGARVAIKAGEPARATEALQAGSRVGSRCSLLGMQGQVSRPRSALLAQGVSQLQVPEEPARVSGGRWRHRLGAVRDSGPDKGQTSL